MKSAKDFIRPIPYFDVFDPRFSDFSVKMAARGSMIFNITDYKAFIKAHRLINFDLEQFRTMVREAVIKYVKGMITNAPSDNGIPVLQIERKLLDINDLIAPRLKRVFEEDFHVNLQRFDLDTIEVDKETEEYRELRRITADLEVNMREAQNSINIKNLVDTQSINSVNMSESLRIQREETARFQRLQSESQHIGAHQINQQTMVLAAAAENLGSMGSMNLGGGGAGSGGGGFNPVGIMTGMAVGGAMGGQMANMMNVAGQNIQQPMNTPPPPPQIAYNVSINGQSAGPFNQSQLLDMVRSGQLNKDSYVWKQGMSNWENAGIVQELSTLFAAVPASPPPPPMPPMP
ncbi:MAG: GYF domain-containing protein [Undibacterium sp.]|nr:GYF domain-containing protein [Undibacterium sp.]